MEVGDQRHAPAALPPGRDSVKIWGTFILLAEILARSQYESGHSWYD
jgi:hypothetical protein